MARSDRRFVDWFGRNTGLDSSFDLRVVRLQLCEGKPDKIVKPLFHAILLCARCSKTSGFFIFQIG